MAVKVVWTDEAVATIEAIVDYVRLFDADAAAGLAGRLFDAGQSLADYPARGRPAKDGMRELLTVRPYVLRYRVIADRIDIIRVRHGARQGD